MAAVMSSGGLRPADSYAEGVLREMYGGSLPREACKLLQRHHAACGRSNSAPARGRSGAPSWSTGLGTRSAPRKCVDLKVPRVGQQRGSGEAPLPPRLPSRKTHSQIVVETQGYDPRLVEPVTGPRGRDLGAEKRRLQDQHTYGGGSVLPSAGMMPGIDIASASCHSARRRVAASCSPRVGKLQSLAADADSLAADIVQCVRERQGELETVESKLANLAERAEAPAGQIPADARRRLRAQVAAVNHERLELQSAIRRDVHDLDRVLGTTEDE